MSKIKKFVDIDSLKFYNTLLEIKINRTLENYALRNDVTSVLRFKGTKTSDELGALTGMETGDVYSIVSGGEGDTYKVGSEYAYDGTNWIELGPALDFSGIMDVIEALASRVEELERQMIVNSEASDGANDFSEVEPENSSDFVVTDYE